MEVMLERVQFKFASIIGELCSEPLVLSQFAVWVDMRLAEYKLKGSISLDCSGDSPDPIWIKGVTFALKEKLKAAEESAAKAISGVISHRTGVGQDFDRQGRSDSRGRSGSVADGPSLADITQDLHVKPEPIDETSAFPVSLYTNNEKINSPPSHRKRPIHVSSTHPNSATSSQSYTSEIGEPMPKSSRLSVDEQDLTGSVDPDNTSLLSIIGMNDSQLDSSTNNDNDDDIIECDMTSFQTPSQATSDNPGRLPAAQGSSKQEYTAGTTGLRSSPSQAGQSSSLLSPQLLPFPPNLSREARLKRLDKRTRSHITIFERFLMRKGVEDISFESMACEELDRHLSDFYTNVQRSNGTNFTRSSFTNIRNNLGRYLRNVGYPQNIIVSPAFQGSQHAFKRRVMSLSLFSPDAVTKFAAEISQ